MERNKEIQAVELAIKTIKRDWGAGCEDLDPNWHLDGGCSTCKAGKVVAFMEEHLEYLREREQETTQPNDGAPAPHTI